VPPVTAYSFIQPDIRNSRGHVSMFRLDYISCALTVLSTILIANKRWAGFVVAAVNSGLICCIGLETHQTGFIPANLFCIVIYSFSVRSWKRQSPRSTASPLDNEECG